MYSTTTISDDLEVLQELSDTGMYSIIEITVDKGQVPLRIDKFLVNRVDASRTRIKQAATNNFLLVNQKAVKTNYKVQPLDEIALLTPKPKGNFEIVPEEMPLNIVYEDQDLLVLNKPAGLVVHPGHGNYTGTLVHGLVHHLDNLPINTYGDIPTEEEEKRPGLVHRIDKDTSGLLVVAKNTPTIAKLAAQFKAHTVHRRYHALVWGDLENDEGTIEGNVGRHNRFRQVMDVFPEGDEGKVAITHYKVLQRFGYVTLVECRLETGRTHQIRVHFKYIGHPLFNDEKYGGDKIVKGTVFSKYKQFITNCFQLLPRQALHAKSLGFVHPTSQENMFFDSELPDDMQQVIDKWARYMGISI
jgi:23S rRNA pseudouridine1911/1915/1917 synthase